MATHFGKYELIERITLGSLAEIFRGRVEGEAGFSKTVALKRILPQFSLEQEFVEAFIEVATVTATLTHANICQIFDFGCIDGRYFASMELVEGRDLRVIQRRVARQGQSLPLALALRVVLEVCKALEYAHEKRDHAGQLIQVVHRSICPSNVLVSFEGAVKLINFGTAKTFAGAAKTAPASTRGQFAHIAPEQIGGELVDGRSDLFSLGILAWELLTGQDLFLGCNEPETLENVRTAPIRPPSELNPEVPEALDTIVLRLLQREPPQRYPSAEELHSDLEAFVRQARIPPGPAKLAAWMQALREEEVAEDDPAAAAAAERRKRPTPLLRRPRVAAALAGHGLTPIALEGEGGEGDEDDDGTRVSAQSAELAQVIAGEQLDEGFEEDDATHDFGDAAAIIAKVDMQRAASRGEVAADDDDEPAFFEDDATEIDMNEPHHDPGMKALPSAEVVIPLPEVFPDPDPAPADPPVEEQAPSLPEELPEETTRPARSSRVLPLLLTLLLLVLAAAAAYHWGYLEDVLGYFKL